MAQDWSIDVKKYVPDADDAVIAKIVRYCGIALTKVDSSLVSFSDPKETARVRNNYCKKKLGLTDSDEDIDAAIARVGERMKADRTKNRVTVYYLLAEAYDKLGIFGGMAKAAAPVAAAAAGAGAVGLMSAAPTSAADYTHDDDAGAVATADAGEAVASAAHSAPAPAAAARAAVTRPDAGIAGFALAAIGGLALIIAGTATVGSLIGGKGGTAPAGAVTSDNLSPPAVGTAVAPVAAAPAAPAPQGAAVVAQEVAGKPMASVYFDTGKSAIAPNFVEATAAIKAWMAANPGDRLAVSGFNDPSGNAVANAELSKNRAKAVAAELAKTGVPADRIDLVKPPETTDTNIDAAQARRVDIVVAN